MVATVIIGTGGIIVIGTGLIILTGVATSGTGIGVGNGGWRMSNGKYRKARTPSYRDSAKGTDHSSVGALTRTGTREAQGAASSLPTGIRAGEIIGWRVWLLNRSRMRLQSILLEFEWDPEWTSEETRPIEGSHGCGFHAWKEFDDAANYRDSLGRYNLNTHDGIIGQVKLWGTVLEHELGYRAQFAKVHTLVSGPRLDLFELREIYGADSGVGK